MKNVIFIYNPNSGERLILEYLDSIISTYQRAGFVVTAIRISRDLGFKPLLQLSEDLTDVDHVLLAGGDGTLNRLVNFMIRHKVDIPIAILPTGTANDFAMMLGMPRGVASGLKAVINGTVKKVDIGKAGGRYFVNIFSCGLFTEISQKTPTSLKNTFGRVAYYFGSLGELPNFRKLNITVRSAELSYTGQCLLFMVFNGRTAGNFPLAMSSDTADGLLDVFIIKGSNIALTIHTLFHFLLKRGNNYPEDVVYFQTNKLSVEMNPGVPTDIDGEPGGDFPMDIECVAQAIRVVVPFSGTRPISATRSRQRERSVMP